MEWWSTYYALDLLTVIQNSLKYMTYIWSITEHGHNSQCAAVCNDLWKYSVCLKSACYADSNSFDASWGFQIICFSNCWSLLHSSSCFLSVLIFHADSQFNLYLYQTLWSLIVCCLIVFEFHLLILWSWSTSPQWPNSGEKYTSCNGSWGGSCTDT